MADPASCLGAISAVLHLSEAVIKLIKQTKAAASERCSLIIDLNETAAICRSLEDTAEIDLNSLSHTLNLLRDNEGATLTRLKKDLENLKHKLEALSVSRSSTKSALRAAQENKNQHMLDKARIDRNRALLDRLTSIDFESTHRDISACRVENTGNWLLQAPQFIEWKSAQTSETLWCSGLPGAGKTVLASLVIDFLRDPASLCNRYKKQPYENDVAGECVAGIYCTYREKLATANILGSILQQLYIKLHSAPEHVPEIIDNAWLSSRLLRVFPDFPRIFLIVDALDECSDNFDLLQQIRSLFRAFSVSATTSILHVFIFSRDSVAADVEKVLLPSKNCHEAGVRRYLQYCLRSHNQLSEWTTDNLEFKQSIVQTISNRVSGMFLLARLYMDLLADIPTKRGVREALKTLPTTVDEMYSDAWQRVLAQKPAQAKLGQRIISWLIHATRPLRKQELQYALAIEEGDHRPELDGLPEVAKLTAYCAGLVTMNEESNLVSLVHPTTSEYFESRNQALFPKGHCDIAVVCITYLCMEPFRDEGACGNIISFLDRCRGNPLLGYAAVNWGTHVRKARAAKAADLAMSILKNVSLRAAAFQALTLNSIGERKSGPEWPLGTMDQLEESRFQASKLPINPIHLATYFGLIDVTDHLLFEGENVDVRDGANLTPIFWAIRGRQAEMLKFLLDRGANPNAEAHISYTRSFPRWYRINWFTSALATASFYLNNEAVEILLQYGAQVRNVQKPGIASTALEAAGLAHNEEAARLLLAKGADINQVPDDIRHAAVLRQFESMESLERYGANQETLKVALEASASAGHHRQVFLLLEYGVDPNAFADPNTIERSHQPINLYPKDKKYATPLTAAVAAFHAFGNEVNQLSYRKYPYADHFEQVSDCVCAILLGITTALHTAAYFGRNDVIQLLIERGAEVNLSIGSRNTALTSALAGESYEQAASVVKGTIELLLELGADLDFCSAADKERIKKLCAMGATDLKMVGLLEEVASRDRYSEYDPRHKMSFRERRDKLRELEAGGADLRLCCDRLQRRINGLLTGSEQDIEAMDRKRIAQIEAINLWSRSPLEG
ncbi:MAG: hypothetical protein Q9167_006382 [Letrouitia subvulpina]